MEVISASEFELLVREHQQRVFRTLSRLVGSSEHVEDLAQEVFFRLYRGLQHFRGESRLETYLYRIILNVAQDEWKRRRGEAGNFSIDEPEEHWDERLPSGECDAEELFSGRQMEAALQSALAELSESERSVLLLFHQEDCTYEQIAHLLSCPIGTVRTHLHRGRQRLKKLMQNRMRVCPKTSTNVS